MNKKKIVFADSCCPKPYTGKTFREEGMGGTEATVVKIAEELASREYEVTVCQHNRTEDQTFNAVKYTTDLPEEMDHIVVLRDLRTLKNIVEHYPQTKRASKTLWMHDLVNQDFAQNNHIIVEANASIIAVSQYHSTQIKEACQRNKDFNGRLNLKTIYNPIADDLRPDETKVDPNKFIFFSSPHKGLEYTLQIFSAFENFDELKGAKLYIANPGYMPNVDLEGIMENVVNLSSLPNAEVINHLRDAFCVLHLNHVFPETFGIVYAEAQAVGTPFLSHPLGAVPELTDHPNCIMDVRSPKDVIDRVLHWRAHGRPFVRLKKKFRMSEVARQWENHFKSLCT